MITFARVLLLFKEHLYMGAYRINYDLFSALFYDFLQDNEEYNLNKSSMSRWRSGRQAVAPKIVQYYARPGYDLVLATTIEERFAPSMSDICELADKLYKQICSDQQLTAVERAILCNGYVSGEIGPSAELIARLMIYAMQQIPEVAQQTIRAA